MREIHSLSLGLGFANFANHVRLVAWQAERPMETGRLMSRGAHNFKQGDVTKALKGAVNAGLAVRRFEIDRDGKIVVIAGRPDSQEQANEWDAVE
jgi:hypothetical protein